MKTLGGADKQTHLLICEQNRANKEQQAGEVWKRETRERGESVEKEKKIINDRRKLN